MIRPNDIILDLNGSLTEQLKTNSQQAINDVVAALGVTGPTESVKESRESGNGITLANGDYGGWMSEKSGSVYKALGAMSKVVKTVTLAQDCIIDGIHFSGSDTNKDALVSVNTGASVVFRNCIFEKRAGDGAPYVNMGPTSGAFISRANFIGCVFQGPNVGAVISNPGAAANVNTIGCHDKTGGGFAGTTATGNL
jgi:hypothetical protein